MEQKVELKPCPWCGKTPKVLRVDFTDPIEYGVACLNMSCPIRPSAGCFDTEEEAAQAWNSMQERTCHIEEAEFEFIGSDDHKKGIARCYVCSECQDMIEQDANYCPNCGAKVVKDD